MADGSSSTVMFVVDDPAVLLVVSSSLSCGVLVSPLGGELTTFSSFLFEMPLLAVDKETVPAGDGDRAGTLSRATTGELISLDGALLPIIFICLPFHTDGAGGDITVFLGSDTAASAGLLIEPTSFDGAGLGSAGAAALPPKMLSLRPFQAMMISIDDGCGLATILFIQCERGD